MTTPADLHYTKEHEWVRVEGEMLVVGITAYAAEHLGDVVFVELPEEGAAITAGQPFGVVESVKSVSDLFAPVSGTVIASNRELSATPELVNEAPYQAGWMLRVKPDDPAALAGLLSADDYAALIQE